MDRAAHDLGKKIHDELKSIRADLTRAPVKQAAESDKENYHPRQQGNGAQANATTSAQSGPKNSDDSKERWYQRIDWFKCIQATGVCVAIFVASINYRQFATIRRNFSIDERAWLQVKISEERQKLDLAAFEGPLLDMDIVNVGKTPARKVSMRSTGTFLPRSKGPNLNVFAGRNLTAGILYPQAPMATLVGTDVKLTDPIRTALARGDMYLAVWGEVTFDDIFGKPHWTRFCVFVHFSPKALEYSAKQCTDYNNTDSE